MVLLSLGRAPPGSAAPVFSRRRGYFDHLLGNGNQAPQGLNVLACLTPDRLGLRTVVAVFPAWSTAALKTLWRLRAVTLADFRPPTPR